MRIRDNRLVLTVAQVGLIAVLALTAAAAVIELRRPVDLPGWGTTLHPRWPPAGTLAVASLVVLIMSAYAVHDLLPRAARFVPWLVVLHAGLVVAHAPQLVAKTPDRDAATLVLRGVLAAALAVLVVKVLLLHKFARSRRARTVAPRPAALLPSRQADFENLKSLIARGGDHGGRVIPIQGRWGEGKSFLLHALVNDPAYSSDTSARRRRYASQPPPSDDQRHTLVVVDVWKLEREADLQVKIIEALLGEPAFLRRYRWLHVPVAFGAADLVAYLYTALQSLRLKLTAPVGDMEAELRMPRLNWQPFFEQITRAAGGAGVVIALDELDRATPTVTQAALTLARRSETARVTVLLSYTRELIQYKAFNPLLPTLPDLSSSMEAVLYEDALARSGRSIHDWSSAVEVHRDAALGLDGKDLVTALKAGFAGEPTHRRELLQRRFEEKYLGPAGLTLTLPTGEDLAAMLTMFDELAEQVRRTLSDPSDASLKEVEALVREGHPKWRLPGDPPSVRVLHGTLWTIFRRAAEVAPGRLGPPDVAVLALSALDIAAFAYETPRPDGSV